MSHQQNPLQVVVIGAGYAGLMAAFRLAGKTRNHHLAITLVNPVENFVERPLLHELATNRPPRQHSLASLLNGSPVQFRKGQVTVLRPDDNVVTIQDETGGHQLRYDYLIYTPGSRVDRESVPGAREYAYALDPSGPMSAAALRDKLLALSETGGRVLVVGSGPTGIEVGAEIADAFPKLQVHIITQGEFGAFKNRRVQRYMRQAVQRLKITIAEQTAITEVRAHEVVIQKGDTIGFDVLVWAGGFRALPLAREAGLTVNERDQILVDPYMRSVSHPAIFGAGDSAHTVIQPGAPVRMGLFGTLVMAAHAADSLSRIIKGQQPKPLGFSYYGQAIALGRRDAVGFATFPDDQPIGPLYTGVVGLKMRNFFVALLLKMITWTKRWPGVFFWMGGRRGWKAVKRHAMSVRVGHPLSS
jgi:NADH dehydrogenase FAD-containing subunit